MFRNKERTVKDGYILINVVIIGTICMTFALYCFKFQMQERKTKLNQSNHYMKLNQESREHLLTKLNKDIENKHKNNNIILLDQENIEKYFLSISTTKLATYKDTYVKFEKNVIEDKDDKYYFTLMLHYGADDHLKEKYDYIIRNGKLKFVYVKTIYKGGIIPNEI